MSNLFVVVEACLFASSKPLSCKDLSQLTGASEVVVGSVVDELWKIKNTSHSGIHLIKVDGKFQLVSNPEAAATVGRLAKEDEAAELTRPSLEALTIIAYRGPVTKPEIEAIRGVNCSLILRNLLMRGLIEDREDRQRLQPVYVLSVAALRHLGLHGVSELPDYASLHANAQIDKLLQSLLLETSLA